MEVALRRRPAAEVETAAELRSVCPGAQDLVRWCVLQWGASLAL